MQREKWAALWPKCVENPQIDRLNSRKAVPSGFEPESQAPEARILSIVLWDRGRQR
jgi:hypothetical protein